MGEELDDSEHQGKRGINSPAATRIPKKFSNMGNNQLNNSVDVVHSSNFNNKQRQRSNNSVLMERSFDKVIGSYFNRDLFINPIDSIFGQGKSNSEVKPETKTPEKRHTSFSKHLA